jgi:hypothetical protein
MFYPILQPQKSSAFCMLNACYLHITTYLYVSGCDITMEGSGVLQGLLKEIERVCWRGEGKRNNKGGFIFG